MNFIEETDTRFELKESTLPNAGWGCFTKEYLKAGDWLEIIGVYVKVGGLADQCTHYAKRYKFAGSPKKNAKIVPMGFGGMVNHSDDPNLQNCQLEYVPGLSRRSEHSGQVIYRFIRDVLPGEELIGNYGPEIGQEIKQMNENIDFVDHHQAEIDRFLKFGLYNLDTIVDNLRKIGIKHVN
jgi:hypothetical protein